MLRQFRPWHCQRLSASPQKTKSAWVPLFPRGVNNSSREVWVKNRKPRCQFSTSLSVPVPYFCIFFEGVIKADFPKSFPHCYRQTPSVTALCMKAGVCLRCPASGEPLDLAALSAASFSFCTTILLKERRVRGAAEHNCAQTFVIERVIEHKTINSTCYKLPLNHV